MVDMFAPQLFPLVTSNVRKSSHFKGMEVTSGADAALFIVELMQAAGKQIPPPKLCTAYEHAGGGKSKNTITALWNHFGTDTACSNELGDAGAGLDLGRRVAARRG